MPSSLLKRMSGSPFSTIEGTMRGIVENTGFTQFPIVDKFLRTNCLRPDELKLVTDHLAEVFDKKFGHLVTGTPEQLQASIGPIRELLLEIMGACVVHAKAHPLIAHNYADHELFGDLDTASRQNLGFINPADLPDRRTGFIYNLSDFGINATMYKPVAFLVRDPIKLDWSYERFLNPESLSLDQLTTQVIAQRDSKDKGFGKQPIGPFSPFPRR